MLGLLALLAGFGGSGGEAEPSYHNREGVQQLCRTNVTARAGLTARLFCCLAIKYRDLTISWVRREDVVILSHGTTVFTSDNRFSVHHHSGSGLWELRIRLVALSDQGKYRCQGNSEPPALEREVVLSVEDTVAKIKGPKHRYIPAGSDLELECQVDLGEHGPDDHYRQTAVLHWLVNGRVLDPGKDGGENRVTANQRIAGYLFQGQLTVRRLSLGDSGNYSCLPSYTTPDMVVIHITTVEEPAGLQLHHSNSATAVLRSRQFSCTILLAWIASSLK